MLVMAEISTRKGTIQMVFVSGFATRRFGRETHAIYLLDEQHCIETDFFDVGAMLEKGINLPEFRSHLLENPKTVPYLASELTPLVRYPSKIICLGLNYADHVAEMGRKGANFPTLFAKFSDSMTGPYSDIELPTNSQQVDYEAELAIIIGRTATKVPVEAAANYIAGFTISNDVSMRDYQWRTSQFLQGKIFDASTPLGPVLVNAVDVDFGHDLAITSLVNGQIRQASRTSQMIFGINETISYISQITTLRPGDVVLTGTPRGVGAAMDPPTFLKSGDIVTCEIEGLGSISNLFV